MDFALDLPEIRTLIGSFLSKQDIYSVRLVSHAWNATCAPIFWQRMRSINPESFPPTLGKHTHHIHHLVIGHNSPTALYDLHGFNHLKTLTVHIGRGRRQQGQEDEDTAAPRLPEFIQHQCSTITRLYLYQMGSLGSIQLSDLWKVVRLGCLGLERLRIEGVQMEKEDLQGMWGTISELGIRHLYLDRVNVVLGAQEVVEEPWFSQESKIEVLSFKNSDWNRSWFLPCLQQCPELRTLKDFNFDRAFEAPFLGLLRQGRWKYLESVLFDKYQDVTDNFAATLIRAMCRVRSFKIGMSDFGEHAFRALQDHRYGFVVIQELQLDSCLNVTSEMVRTVLESCPRLVEFWAPKIEGKDVVESKPWACVSTLRLLHIGIRLSRRMGLNQDKEEICKESRAILSRFADLTELCTLGITSYESGFQVSLASGLDELATLTKLQEFKFKNCTHFFKEAEVVWMLDHWPGVSSTELQLVNKIRLEDRRLRDRQIVLRSVGSLIVTDLT